jgi:hypothetical protein
VVEGALGLALAVAVGAVACFCAGRLLLGLLWHRPAERDVDVVHVVMGAAMAGMLIGSFSGRWMLVWMPAFLASAAWFGWRVWRELPAGGHTADGHLPHLVASIAMLYMLVAMWWLAPAGSSYAMGAMPSMRVGSDGVPVLAVGVAALLVVDAALSASRMLTVGTQGGGSVTVHARPLAPRGTAACTLVMSLAMAAMLVAVHP